MESEESKAARRKRREMFFRAVYPMIEYYEAFGTADATGRAIAKTLEEVLTEDVLRSLEVVPASPPREAL